MIDNLKNIDGTWYVRVSIPKDVRSEFGHRTEFLKSLKTGRKSEALVLRNKYLTEWKTLIAKARMGNSADREVQLFSSSYPGRLETLMFLKDAQAARREARKVAYLASDDDEVVEAVAVLQRMREDLSQTLPEGEIERIFPELYEDLPHTFNKAERLLEDLNNRFLIHIATGTTNKSDEQQTLIELVKTPSKFKKKHPISDKTLELFHRHEVERKVELQTVDVHVKKLKAFRKYLEENDFELSFDSTKAFLDSKDVVDKTKKQYLFSFGAFYKYAFSEQNKFRDKYPHNPFYGHTVSKVKRGAKKEITRKAFSKSQVKHLHDKALEQNNQRLANLIKVGAYTGARIEEICQLKVKDIVIEDGVKCLDIREAKTSAGDRFVPIHSEIEPLIDQLVKESGDGYLFKTNRGGKYGIKSKDMSSEFSFFKTSLEYSTEYVFHSLRKTTITELERADVKNILVMAIVGHEIGGNLNLTFDRYSEGPTPKAKKDAVERIKFDI